MSIGIADDMKEKETAGIDSSEASSNVALKAYDR